MSKKQMLIVDDNTALREALKAVFEDEYELRFAASGEEALRQYRQHAPQVVLMDYKMPDMDGLETLQYMQPRTNNSRVVMMSAFDDKITMEAARRRGATDFVGKPFDVAQLKNIISQQAKAAKPQSEASPAVMTQIELNDLIHQTLRLTCV